MNNQAVIDMLLAEIEASEYLDEETKKIARGLRSDALQEMEEMPSEAQETLSRALTPSQREDNGPAPDFLGDLAGKGKGILSSFFDREEVVPTRSITPDEMDIAIQKDRGEPTGEVLEEMGKKKGYDVEAMLDLLGRGSKRPEVDVSDNAIERAVNASRHQNTRKPSVY